MGDFSSATGAVTFVMMLLSRTIFKKYGWGVAALITPVVLLITGLSLLACCLVLGMYVQRNHCYSVVFMVQELAGFVHCLPQIELVCSFLLVRKPCTYLLQHAVPHHHHHATLFSS